MQFIILFFSIKNCAKVYVIFNILINLKIDLNYFESGFKYVYCIVQSSPLSYLHSFFHFVKLKLYTH